MKIWEITLKYPDGPAKKLDLFDVKGLFNGYLKIKRSYFDHLLKVIKITKNYFTGNAIERIISPDKDDWTFNPWMLVLIQDNEKKKPFWLLIKRERDLSGELVAIGPKTFADYNDSNSDDARRDLKRLMTYLVVYINKFECSVLLPNYLS
ncbi:MAG: hypothetical protein ACXACC_06650 [Promethearchaeota archaeon]|jgi:hypothetical protein